MRLRPNAPLNKGGWGDLLLSLRCGNNQRSKSLYSLYLLRGGNQFSIIFQAYLPARHLVHADVRFCSANVRAGTHPPSGSSPSRRVLPPSSRTAPSFLSRVIPSIPFHKGGRGDSLLECGGRIVGIYQGQLAVPETDLFGPEVAPHSRPACLDDGNIIALAERRASTYSC